MLNKICTNILIKSISCRQLYIGSKNFSKENLKTHFSPPKREDIKYHFAQIENDSLIKLLSQGYFKPSLLKMPDSQPTDEVSQHLIKNISTMDLSMYEKGMEQLKRAGVFGALIPKEYGGLGLNSSQYAYLIQSENLIDWSLVLIAHQNLCAETILKYGSSEQKDRYLPKLASGDWLGAFCLNEHCSGNDMFSMESAAVLGPLRDHYILRGTKNWVINGHFADVFVVFSLSRDSMEEGGRTFITGFIAERNDPGVSVSESYNIDWLQNCAVSDVIFDNVSLSIERVLSEENGGYKIAHHIQNNARYIVAASVSGIMRKLVNDLVEFEKSQMISNNTLVKSLIDRCKVILYAVESSLYFTTRFADNYYSPEIQLESAALKVYSIEKALDLLDKYHQILSLISQPVPSYFLNYYKIVNGIQNFMGSNFYNKLYIGGTMIQLSSLRAAEFRKRLSSPMQNIPWLKTSLREAFNPMTVIERSTDPLIVDVSKYNIFMKDLRNIFIKLSRTRNLLMKAFAEYKEDTYEYQHLMTFMSDIGILIYTLSCSIARANTTYGKFEIDSAKSIQLEISSLIEERINLIQYIQEGNVKMFKEMLMEDIIQVGRYVPVNILEMRRELGETKTVIPPWVEHKYNK